MASAIVAATASRREDGAQRAPHGLASDDLEQVAVAQQRRILKYRRGYDELDVARQAPDDPPGDGGAALDLLGDDLAHPRKLVVGKRLENLEGQPVHLVLGFRAEPRRKAADFARQVAAHLIVDVVDQQAVGLPGRVFVGGDLAPDVDEVVGGQIIEDLGSHVAAGGQLAPRIAVAVAGEILRLAVGNRGRAVVPIVRDDLVQ